LGIWALAGPVPGSHVPIVRAEDAPEQIALGEQRPRVRHPIQRPDTHNRRAGQIAAASGGWWIGTTGIAIVLAVLGVISLVSKRWRVLPRGNNGPLQVVGRTHLSPRQCVYLLRAGDRVLIVGAGTQGAPTLLGELTDRDELGRLLAARGSNTVPQGYDPVEGDHP
jgi:flagellar biogenesis protein FliO